MPAPISDSAVYQDTINGPVDGDDVDQSTFLTNWLVPLASRDVWLKRAAASYLAIEPGDDANDVTQAVVRVVYSGDWAGPPENGTVIRFANELTGTRKMVLIDRIDAGQSLTFRNASGVEMGVFTAPQTQTRVAFEWVATSDSGEWTLVWSNAVPFSRDYALTAIGGTSMVDWGASEVMLAGFINTEFTLVLNQSSIGGLGYFAPNELKRVRINYMAHGSVFRLSYSGKETTFTADRPMEDVELVFQYSAAGFGAEWLLRAHRFREAGTSVTISTTASPYQISNGVTMLVNTASFVDAGFTMYAPTDPWPGQTIDIVIDSMTMSPGQNFAAAVYTEQGGTVIGLISADETNPVNKGWIRIKYNGSVWRCVGAGVNHQLT